ncbi:MAG: hypothetical protein GY898_22845 [Proteobacteria bacterium]|nr:hypothetical protein [Pseudomonadota bacterium]
MAAVRLLLLLLLLLALLGTVGCASNQVALDCDDATAAPGEVIAVTATHARALTPGASKPAFVIRPISGAAGRWTMAEAEASPGPWARTEYRGQFAASSPGRFRLEALMGARTAASCEVTVHAPRLALVGLPQ